MRHLATAFKLFDRNQPINRTIAFINAKPSKMPTPPWNRLIGSLRSRMVAGLIAFLAGMSQCASAAAEIATGDQFTQFILTETGFRIPLPPGDWQVTSKAEHSETAGQQNIVVLKNRAPSQIAYSIISYTRKLYTAQWRGECNRNISVVFEKQNFGIQPSDLIHKCLEIYTPQNRLIYAYQPSWEALATGIDNEDLKAPGKFLTIAFNVSKWKDHFFYVNFLIKPAASGYSPRKIRDDALAGTPNPWLESLRAWSSSYMSALFQSTLERKPTSAVAFESPTSSISALATANRQPSSTEEKPQNESAQLKQQAPAAQQPTQAQTRQDRLTQEARQNEQTRIAQEALKKEQDRQLADQKIREQLRVAEEAAKGKDLELARLKEELASIRQKKDNPATVPITRKALVIGNDNYMHVTRLSNARQDANAVGKTLSDLGYRVTIKNDLTEKDMKATLRQFKNELEGGDEVVIFYAGHGVQIGSTNYLMPTDIKGESEDQVRDDAIQLQRFLDDMNERKVKFTLAMIDACRDNPFPKTARAIGSRGLAPTTAATGQMIIFSAGSGQQALDKLGPGDKNPNGLFTRMLLAEMTNRGVRVDNMIREVRRKVVDAAKSVGHEQVPAIYDQVVGDFYFNK